MSPSSPSALVVQPDPTETAGLVGAALVARGFRLVPWTIQADPAQPEGRTDPPGWDGYDLVVVTGSPWSVFDARVEHWVRPLLRLLRSSTEAGVPVLGICFGAQALAAAFGAPVVRTARPEVGWHHVTSRWGALEGSWFQWHQDVFEVPAGAEELARSAVGPQAFTLARALGVQFHPEVDSRHLEAWLAGVGRAEIERHGVDADLLVAVTRARDAEMASRVGALVDWFLESPGLSPSEPARPGSPDRSG